MRKFSALLLLYAGFLCLSTCEAKCRRKNPTKLKRSLNLAISSDEINNRHQAGLRKIFRRKRYIKDKEITESEKFTAEIKFLRKWLPAMSKKDGSAYRLFEGNVLDAILEQMNADRRFINSRVLDLRKTPDGILAQVGFHFRKSEHNPISHIRFVVSRGHLSGLKVDKHYFKLLKTPAKFSTDNDNSKTSTQQQQSTKVQSILQSKSGEPKQEPVEKSPVHHVQNEFPSASVGSQTSAQSNNQLPTNTYQTLTPASAESRNQSQNEGPTLASPQNQARTQYQATQEQSQDHIQSNEGQQQPKNQNQNLDAVQVTNQHQVQEASKVQSQNPAQLQDNVNTQTTDNTNSSNQASTQDETVAVAHQQTFPQDQNRAVYQQTEQMSAQNYESQTSPNPSNGFQTQSNDQSNVGNQEDPNVRPTDNGRLQMSGIQDSQKKQESAPVFTSNDEENISIKMNQAWYPFLSNHDSLQYKMLTGNLEKGLKSVMGDDKNIKDIKVKNLMQADKEHTTVEFLLKFNGAGKEGSTEKLRNIVKSGDIAGISVDANFFKDNKVVVQK